MARILKAGEYRTISGATYNLLRDTEPLCEQGGDIFYRMTDHEGDNAIIPLSRIVTEEGDGGDGGGYSTSYSTSAGSNSSGTDTVGGRAKPTKKKKKKQPAAMKRS